MNISDIELIRTVSSPTVAPDGSRVVFSVTRPDIAADGYVGQLWQVPTDGSAPAERLTRGFRDTSPVFSPDGSLIAFLRAGPAAAPQLYVVRSTGGEPLAVTDAKLGVKDPSWSSDSRRIVYVSRVAEPGRYGTVEGISAAAEPGRRITTTRYLCNGVGYLPDQRAHVFLVGVPDVTGEPFVPAAASVEQPDPAESGESGLPVPVRLTSAEADHAHPRFTSDDAAVTFVAAMHEGRDQDLRSGAYAVKLSADGQPTDITEVLGVAHDLSVRDVLPTSGGPTFVLAIAVGPDGLAFVGSNTALYAVDAWGQTPRRLTDPERVDLQASALVDFRGDGVVLQDTTRGTVQLLVVEPSGGTQRMTDGPLEIGGVASAADMVAAAVVDATSAGDIAVWSEGGLLRLTDFSEPLRASGLVEAQELLVSVRDGQQIQGWVLVPSGDGPHPTLLVIHGGPYAQFTGSVFDEAQVYVAAGYGVAMCNPRGAAGYGQTFGRVIQERMGTVDMTDVLDFLDGAVAAHPSLDGHRVGIMGGSYGGYLTAWTTAHEHRFAGAIVERGFLDPELFTGTSDIGTYFSEQYTGAEPQHQRTQSPQAVVSQVRTPTLLIHSENDLRCPLSQAERYHLGLVRAGVETEMLIFPGEDHELSRSGRPRHRVQRFEAILDWWQRYLPVPLR